MSCMPIIIEFSRMMEHEGVVSLEKDKAKELIKKYKLSWKVDKKRQG